MSDNQVTFDRRTQAELRTIFPAACEALRPFFDPTNHWAGQIQEHLAFRTLKEQFPALSAQESFIVVMTVKRLFAIGHYSSMPEAA
jgi:hypothetical protein